jgi:hypothetical protein
MAALGNRHFAPEGASVLLLDKIQVQIVIRDWPRRRDPLVPDLWEVEISSIGV